MKLRKKKPNANSHADSAKDEFKIGSLICEILYKRGSVNILDPLKPTTDIDALLERNPDAVTYPFCDGHPDSIDIDEELMVEDDEDE